MSEISDKIQFSGSMNSDDGLRSLPHGDYLPETFNGHIHVTEKSNDGSVENDRGTLLIANTLPAGINKTIGSYEDTAKKRIIYFNSNSSGADGIYQFYPDKGINGEIETILVDDPLNQVLKFNPEFKITAINVIESLTGDLLKWTDNFQRPRKINIDKANETNKRRKFDLFLKISGSYTTTIFNPDGSVAVTWTWTNAVAGSGRPLEYFVAGYLTNVPAQALAIAEFTTCHQFLSVQMRTAGMYTMTISSTPTSYAIANNFYPLPFKEEFIDAIKYPSSCQPLVAAKQDLTKRINLIQNKVFQFRILLVSDDNEKTVYSPYSRIADLPISCGQNATQSTFNYIAVDFNEPRLFDLGSLSVINKIEVAVREHITGKLKYVTTLDKWQFLQTNNIYNFYNDGIYSVIDAAIDGKNYDSLPLLAKSQEFGVNRIEYGGITEGYDPICIDASLSLSYEANVKTSLFSFSGKIFIKNFFVNNSDYANYQPIHNLGSGAVFGGFGDSDIVNQVGSEWGQTIPLGGFIMYLAGTNHKAVSKQPAFPDYGVIQDSLGVMSSDVNSGNILAGCNGNNKTPRKKVKCQIEDGGVWSEYAFTNVPAGRYILRVASHLTTQNDLNSSLSWQTTSTYTMSVAGASGYRGKNEALLEIIDNGNGTATINIRDSRTDAITYTALGNQLADTYIADLTDPRVGTTASIAISGYATDADITPTPSTDVGLLEDTRIELARVGITYNDSGSIQNTFSLSAWQPYVSEFINKFVYTDHNGFFWWCAIHNGLNGHIHADSVRVLSVFSAPLELGGYNSNNTIGLHSGIFRASSAGVYNNVRTKLTGNVNFNGQPVSDINVLTTRGNYDKTDVAGDFDMYIYGDTYPYMLSPTITREDQVLFTVPDTCIIVFNPSSVKYAVAIGDPSVNPMYHNATTPFPITGIVIVSIQGQTGIAGLKRGGKYSYGITYYDNALRDNNVNTSNLLNLSIPFYTEGTPIIGQGRPIVDMDINNTPPDWATHYQIVRTLNGNQGKYLQWTAKSVTYVDNDGNTTSFSQATQIKIDLEGINAFNSKNVDSKISYTFEEGDRLVLIKDGNNQNFFNSYIDFKIKGSKTGASLILYVDNLVNAGQIPAGTLFEIYNPIKKYDIELYYEIGECFEIGDFGLPTAYHQGTSQNQIVVNGQSIQPARVRLTTGDTWYRFRTMYYSSTNVIGGAADKPVLWAIEDPSISDFYESKDQSIGRFHILDKDFGQRYRPTAIRFSNVILEETKINGLNSFEGLNEKVLPIEYGLIQKLIMSKDVLCSIHNNSQFVTMYLGKEVLLDNSMQNLVALSEQVIQKSYQYQGGLGTQNPECICIDENNTVYGYDNAKGIVWAKEVNGLIPISEIKMRTYFRDKSLLLNMNGGTFIYGVYDNRFGQYKMAFEEIAEEVLPDTIAYNNRKNGWEMRYNFHPEYFGGAKNNVLVSFKNGQLWRHNSSVYCNYYGVQYKQSVDVVANQLPSDTKVYLYMSTESSHAWATPTNGIITLEGQTSELAKTDFENIGNTFRADFLKDTSTVNVPNPLIEGDDLRSSILRINIENNEAIYSTIYAINVYSIKSENTNK